MKKTELVSIAISILVLTVIFLISDIFLKQIPEIQRAIYLLIGIIITISLNIASKKITSNYLDIEIENRIWEISRFGYKPSTKFPQPLQIGIILPLIASFLSFGTIKLMASMVFDVKSKTSHASKRHGIYKFYEIPESHIGLIAASGIIVNILLAIIAYFINLPDLARMNIYYATSNLIPLSDLDGNKILFGNLLTWNILAIITIIGLIYSIIII